MSARSRAIQAVVLRRALASFAGARFGFASRTRRRQSVAKQVRIAAEELGPAFIKLGQVASVRPDIVPAHLVFELERLQDSVPPVDIDSIRRVVSGQLGAPPEELFDDFEAKPIASASIAQVHRARLRRDVRPVSGQTMRAGTPVAVKVVKPGAEGIIAADIAEARRLVSRIAGKGPLGRIDIAALLEEFATTLASELDLRNEGRVADRFAFDFRDDELMVVPRIAWPLSTREVLTMEFVEGWRLSELDEVTRAGIDGYRLALHGAEVFMRQVLVLGTFHADLHPANLFVTPDGRICYLDFGICGCTRPEQRLAIAQVLAATVYGDADRAVRYSRELGLDIPDEIEPALRAAVSALMDATLRRRDGSAPDIRGFAVGFLGIMGDFQIRVPVGFGLLVKALVTVEGVATALYPGIDITQAARPFATRLIAAELMTPERLAERSAAAVRAALREFAT